jgi:hypothetical protein
MNTSNGIVGGNVDAGDFQFSTAETGGTYRLGLHGRPHYTPDNGHLRLGRRSPTEADYMALLKWRAMLEGAEILRPDLTDALACYRHFLEGEGKTRSFQYERYVTSDQSGQVTLRNAILEFQQVSVRLWQQAGKPLTFALTGPMIPCGINDKKKRPYLASHFPYPATENWQKAIGSHVIWLSGEIAVSHDPRMSPPDYFRGHMTLHAEDRYNFNPGDHDIATKIPDDENGRFEMTGLAHQYDNVSTLARVLTWQGLEMGVGLAAAPNTVRLRQPSDNRNAGNRL